MGCLPFGYALLLSLLAFCYAVDVCGAVEEDEISVGWVGRMRSVGDESVEAYAIRVLMAVGEKIPRVGTFIDVIHVVIGSGVEGHADVLRFQKLLVLAIIACDINVPTAETFLCLCGIIETHPIGEEEGIVLHHAFLIGNVERFGY